MMTMYIVFIYPLNISISVSAMYYYYTRQGYLGRLSASFKASTLSAISNDIHISRKLTTRSCYSADRRYSNLLCRKLSATNKTIEI